MGWPSAHAWLSTAFDSGSSTPAAWTTTSSLPYAATVSSTTASTSTACETSTNAGRTVGQSPAIAFAPSLSRSAMITASHPSSASRRVTAAPMPEEPPVTSATLPAKRSSVVIGLLLLSGDVHGQVLGSWARPRAAAGPCLLYTSDAADDL